MIVDMKRIFISCLLLTISSSPLKAGLDEFSFLEQIDDWIIERKVDSKTQVVSCRASIKGYATWFSGRIHLNKDGKLVVPKEYISFKHPPLSKINEIKNTLIKCRSSLIYLPDQ